MSFPNMVPAAPLLVAVGEEQIEVRGIKATGLGRLIQRFEGLRQLKISSNAQLVAQLFDLGDELVAAIIAAGVGHAADVQVEAWANELALDKQTEFVTAIITRTISGGIGPFVQKTIPALVAALKVETVESTEAKASPPPGKRSASPSISSSARTTAPAKSGT